MENIQNYKDALASVSKKEMEQRKTIKRLLQEKEELKKQLALHDVSNYVICDDWINEERVKQNDDNYCPICGKQLQSK